MASTELRDDKMREAGELPVRLNDHGKEMDKSQDAARGPEDYSVERVERVYR
jgi:hypothetical protein